MKRQDDSGRIDSRTAPQDAPAGQPVAASPILATCRHQLLVVQMPPPNADLECRWCVTPTLTVAEWLADHVGGGDLRQVAATLGVSWQAIQQMERRAMAKAGRLLRLRFPDAFDEGDLVSDAEAFRRVVARMRADGMTRHDIVELLGEPVRRVEKALKKGTR